LGRRAHGGTDIPNAVPADREPRPQSRRLIERNDNQNNHDQVK
jgi:hypothetical protein